MGRESITTLNLYAKKKTKLSNCKKYILFKNEKHESNCYMLNFKGTNRKLNKIYSMPVLANLENKHRKSIYWKTCMYIPKQSVKFKSDYIVNILFESRNSERVQSRVISMPFKPCWNIFRCQLNAQEETCCCSCNSDAMFEVMKSLYDCYKKKNCDNCNCILCGHLPREERRLGEMRKSEIDLVKEDEKKMRKKKIKSAYKIPSVKLRKAKEKGLLTPLEGKTTEQKENIIKGLAMTGIPLPEGKTDSEKKIIHKVRAEVGLPPEPKTASTKAKYNKALSAGLITPLEGKTAPEKEKILRGQADLGLPLPVGRTPSEKQLIAKLEAEQREPTILKIPSVKLRKAKEKGLLTPLEGKTTKQKENIIKELAMNGIPFPKGKTESEKKIIDKVRAEVGLPPEPKTLSTKAKYRKALAAGLITPLEGKSASEKERILRGQADLGLPLPVGRTASEKKTLAKLEAAQREPTIVKIPSEKLRKAKEKGLLTPLEGKTTKQKENIIKELAMNGIPLPEGKTDSEKKIIHKVRAEVGLPPEPTSPSTKAKYRKALAAGLITPLEGKTASEKEQILRGQANLGLPLPVGRTASEKNLIARIGTEEKEPSIVKIPSAKLLQAKEKGLLTPLEGKTTKQKENIIKGLAMNGIPLPEGKTDSEKKIIDKVRAEVGLPPEPNTPTTKAKYRKALAAGLITPLEGKSAPEKEKILRGQADLGLPLPVGRTGSEKKLIAKLKAELKEPSVFKIPSAKLRKAKEKGLLTPLEGKTTEQKENIIKGLAMTGIPLPEGKTESEKKIIRKIRAEIGLPPEPKTTLSKAKYKKALAAGFITPLEGKSNKEKENIVRKQAEMGILLPEGRTASEKKIIDKVRKTIGLPPEPKTEKEKIKYNEAFAAGLITPLEGKTLSQKERILVGQADLNIELPKGRSPSEKALIKIVKANKKKKTKLDVKTLKVLKEGKGPSDECICDLLTRESEKKPISLKGKTSVEKENIIRDLAKQGLPLPEAKTLSEKKILQKVQADLGIPPPPASPSLKLKYSRAQKAGVITPLEGKSKAQKEKILIKQAEMGIPLPAGRTSSEKSLINKIRTTIKPLDLEKLSKVGVLTPLEGKTPEEKKRIIKTIIKAGIPLPEGKTPSEKQIIKNVKDEFGLPSKVSSEILRKAKAAGLVTPLEGKTNIQKEKILKARLAAGIPLPEGISPSDKEMIKKVKASAGLLTPLEGKTRSQKEKILQRQIDAGFPLPEGKSPSEKEIIQKIKAKKISKVAIHGKTPSQKEKILKSIAKQGLPLPEPITPSDKAIVDKVRAEITRPERKSPSVKMRQAKAAGLLTPLEGKTPEQKEKILKGLVKTGVPLPEAKTNSEKKLMEKIRDEVGLPPEPKTSAIREKMNQAQLAGIITPLEGKTPSEKQKILKNINDAGLPLPKGRTASEKSLVKKIKAGVRLPESKHKIPSEIFRKAKAAGLMTPLEGKSPTQKEKILKGLDKLNIPLPEGKTPSEEAIIRKILAQKRPEKIKVLDKQTAKIMKEGKGPSDECICELLESMPDKRLIKDEVYKVDSEKLKKAKAAGLLTPLSGKTPEQKEKILKGLAMHGIPLPKAKTSSDKKLISKIRTDVGLPPEPETSSLKAKYNKAMAAGLLTPLQGKSQLQKEKILRGQAEMGLSLPEGRSPSEKVLIDKIRKTVLPLEGKTKEEKEEYFKDMALKGIPLPKPISVSDRRLIDKVRTEVGLPPEPKTASLKEKYDRAEAHGLITPLEGKSITQKEKILQAQAELGVPLPEGRTASEKALISKIKKTTRPLSSVKISKLDKKTAKIMKEKMGPSDECICHILSTDITKEPSWSPLIPPEKLRKAKDAGLLTPLKGKSTTQKEKILKELAMQGIPIPEGKTFSEIKLIDKVRNDLGLPPEPKSKSAKLKYDTAIAAGYIIPLEGKSKEEKENILRKEAEMGLPLPEGRTHSEKDLIEKIKQTVRRPSEVKSVAILTKLEGKTSQEKEKILKSLADAHLPLPEGKTSSDKALIQKIRTEYGIPPKARTLSEKEIIKKAKAEGILTPLKGKTQAQKEKILKGLAKSGLPIPEGTTASEKQLVQKIRTLAGLPPKATPSEKSGKIKTKSKKIGMGKAGIVEEFQDIIKTTTCDRGCGCDKKKIRFKHSYVKIRVTSPDISNLCPCPEECVPGVKGGVFTDNEGIKVTVGRVTGIPSFSSGKTVADTTLRKENDNFLLEKKVVKMFTNANYSKSDSKLSISCCYGRTIYPKKTYSSFYNRNDNTNSFWESNDTTKRKKTFGEYSYNSNSLQDFYLIETSQRGSFDSFDLLNRDSSTSLITLPTSISVISFYTTGYSSDSSTYLKKEFRNINTDKITGWFHSITSTNDNSMYSSQVIKSASDDAPIISSSENTDNHNIFVFRTNTNKNKNTTRILGKSNNAFEFKNLLYQILSQKKLNKSSSVIIIMTTSSSESSSKYSLEEHNCSIIGLDLFEKHFCWSYEANSLNHLRQNQKGFKITTKGRDYERHELYENKKQDTLEKNTIIKDNINRKYNKNVSNQINCRVTSTDTTQDRPCCCVVKEEKTQVWPDLCEQQPKNIVTELVTPIFKEIAAQGSSNEAFINLPTNEIVNQHLSISRSNQCMTPVRLCKVPPCNGQAGCHNHSSPKYQLKQMSLNDACSKNIIKPCDCSPEKIMKLIEKQSKTKACNTTFDKHAKISFAREDVKKTENLCDDCGSSKPTKDKLIKQCPCEQHQKIATENEQIFGNETYNSKNNCKCKMQKISKKKVICECPKEPELEIDFDEWFDEKQIRKFKSDLTQTTSGFKINKPRKKYDYDRELEMSFEETLKYIAENLENEQSKFNKDINCDCPYEPPTLESQEVTPEEKEPFTGIKFHISGKGSGSKGLNGILCFDFIKNTSRP